MEQTVREYFVKVDLGRAILSSRKQTNFLDVSITCQPTYSFDQYVEALRYTLK
jgi:hypothetical protein